MYTKFVNFYNSLIWPAQRFILIIIKTFINPEFQKLPLGGYR